MGKLRGIVAKILLYTLFALLILSFAVWGIGDMFRGRTSAPVVAEVGDMQITQEEYRRAFSAEYHRAQQLLGGSFDIQDAQSLGLPQQVLGDLIGRRLYDAEAERLGLAVTEEQIRQQIFAIPAFQNEFGQFDRFRYEQALRMNQLTEAGLVQRMSSDIARNRILSALASGLRAPQPLAEGLYRYRGETRIADYLVIDRREVGDLPEPDDSELLALYEELIDDFEAPEYREVTWLYIDPAQLAGDVTSDESRLREAYEQRRGEFERPERRAVRQILLDEEEAAETALARIAAGEDFDALAEELTGEPPIELGLVARGEMPAALAEAVFAAEGTGMVAPTESAFGWHVIEVQAIEPGGVSPFEEVREDLALDLAEREAVESAIALANRLDDLIAGGASLEEAAADLNLEARQLDAVSRQGRDQEGGQVSALPDPERFLDSVFRTQPGEESLLTETDTGGFFVVRVDGVIPPAPRPFEAVRDAVAESWRNQERDALAFERADALAERLRAGETLEQLAEAEGLAIRRSEPLARGARQPSAALTEQLFEVRPGEVVVASGPRGPHLAVLREVVAAEPGSDPEQLAELREIAGDGLQQDMEQLFRQALEREYGVSINERRVDDVLLDF